MLRFVACGLFVLLAGCRSGDRPDEAEATPDEADGWQVHIAETEAGEDHPGSVLLTRRAEGNETAFRPRLVLGCEEGVMRAYVEWGSGLGTGETPVTARVDDEPAQALRWRVSEDGEAAGLWDDQASASFIRTLLGHDRLTLQVTPEGARARTDAFALAGLDSLIVPAQQTCGRE